ncbi:hypothetical protein N7478_009689 [Penicillium angulare]|uniref:uncharacterized protein n=1 Tax=Penicillium angulare TaxID=116970 RepID=UPI00254112EA|nr:uncharacterized protein N7478_009689 [Penicillium angulare]KAJ5266881.1 hypothetical protein N7478_009689 [Penicillium angulare]
MVTTASQGVAGGGTVAEAISQALSLDLGATDLSSPEVMQQFILDHPHISTITDFIRKVNTAWGGTDLLWDTMSTHECIVGDGINSVTSQAELEKLHDLGYSTGDLAKVTVVSGTATEFSQPLADKFAEQGAASHAQEVDTKNGSQSDSVSTFSTKIEVDQANGTPRKSKRQKSNKVAKVAGVVAIGMAILL